MQGNPSGCTATLHIHPRALLPGGLLLELLVAAGDRDTARPRSPEPAACGSLLKRPLSGGGKHLEAIMHPNESLPDEVPITLSRG